MNRLCWKPKGVWSATICIQSVLLFLSFIYNLLLMCTPTALSFCFHWPAAALSLELIMGQDRSYMSGLSRIRKRFRGDSRKHNSSRLLQEQNLKIRYKMLLVWKDKQTKIKHELTALNWKCFQNFNTLDALQILIVPFSKCGLKTFMADTKRATSQE